MAEQPATGLRILPPVFFVLALGAMVLLHYALPGEESVVNAFFALWLSIYQDERADEYEPFQRADVVHDRKHRSALMWVERFAVGQSEAPFRDTSKPSRLSFSTIISGVKGCMM